MAGYKVVISGYYGFSNAGDEAMLYAILRALRQSFPGVETTVISGTPEETARKFHTRAIPRFGGLAIARHILSCDLLISGGGSLLQDVTSSRSLLYYLSIILAGILCGKRVFLYGQGIGPLRRKWVCALLRRVLSHVDAITVRDEKSKHLLESLGVKAPVYATADSVLSLPKVSTDRGREILKEAGVPEGKKIIGISVRNWLDAEQWADKFSSYIDRLAEEDAAVVFIPMQWPEDNHMAERLCRGKSDRFFFLEGSFSAPELMSVMGCLDLLVGMRLHALIFAALMHVPLIGISYDPKIDNFLRSIGQEAVFPVSAFDAEKLYNKTKAILSGRTQCRWEAVDALRERAGETVRILQDMVNR